MQLLQCFVCLGGGYTFAQLKIVHPKKCDKSGLKVESNISRIPEILGRLYFYLNKMKTKRLSNHMSQYFIQNRT